MATVSRTKTLGGREVPFESVALLLQGGGALGSYQAGVYQALHEAGLEPDWIAGISIGAINCALIAGNAPADRLDRLMAFWETVTEPGPLGWADSWLNSVQDLWGGDASRSMVNRLASSRAMTNGVPGFYAPRLPPPFLLQPGAAGATSYYDTAPLRDTLTKLVDFDRINQHKAMRFSVGAVNVRSGNFAYFDTETTKIAPEHIMASGALPPAFDAVEIDGEHYWDGGIVSNTPLDWVLSNYPMLDTLAFQVDLWSARGSLPRDLAGVATRMKEVQFSSRTRASTDNFRALQKARGAVSELLAKLPADLASSVEARYLAEIADASVYNIVQLIYRSPDYELQSKDYEFSRKTMLDHWAKGHADANVALAHKDVLTRPRSAFGVQVFDFCSKH